MQDAGCRIGRNRILPTRYLALLPRSHISNLTGVTQLKRNRIHAIWEVRYLNDSRIAELPNCRTAVKQPCPLCKSYDGIGR